MLGAQKDGVAQCVCLVDKLGNRTMRPCLSNAAKIQVHAAFMCFMILNEVEISCWDELTSFYLVVLCQADELIREDFKGSKVMHLRIKLDFC